MSWTLMVKSHAQIVVLWMMPKPLLHGEIPQKVLRNKMQEPKIMKMDWRPLGYWPVYKDGTMEWEKESDAG